MTVLITNENDKARFHQTIAWMVKRLSEPVANAAFGATMKQIKTSVFANPTQGIALELIFVFDDPRPGKEGQERKLQCKSPIVPAVGFSLLCDVLHVFERVILDGLPMILQLADQLWTKEVSDTEVEEHEKKQEEAKPASRIILPYE